MTFEKPKKEIIRFDVSDVLTSSGDWELPIVSDDPEPSSTGDDWETPILNIP